jgi:hypothetical protein
MDLGWVVEGVFSFRMGGGILLILSINSGTVFIFCGS